METVEQRRVDGICLKGNSDSRRPKRVTLQLEILARGPRPRSCSSL